MIKLSTFLTLFCILNLNATSTTLENTSVSFEINDSTNNHTNPVLVHNANVGIFPGESNNGRKFVPKTRFLSLNQDVIVSGIKKASHGKKILVVATNGSITFLHNSSGSSNSNRIAYSSNMTIAQGDAFELTYNANIGKWVITNTNP